MEQYYSDLLHILKSKNELQVSADIKFREGLKEHVIANFDRLKNSELNVDRIISSLVDEFCDANAGYLSSNANKVGTSAPVYLYSDKIPQNKYKYMIHIYSLNNKLAKIANINPYKESFGNVKTIGPFETMEDAQKFVMDNEDIMKKRCNSNIRIVFNGHFNSLTLKPSADPTVKTKFISEDAQGRKILVDTETESIQNDSVNAEELEQRKHDLYEFNKSCEDKDSISYYIIVKQKFDQLMKSKNDAVEFIKELEGKIEDAKKELDELNELHPTFINVWKEEKAKKQETVLTVDSDRKSGLKTLPESKNTISSIDANLPSLFKAS